MFSPSINWVIGIIYVVCASPVLAEMLLLTAGNDLWTVDTRTGDLSFNGTLPVGGDTVLELAKAPDGGLYGLAGGGLYQIEPATANATLIGALDTLGTVAGLAFTPDGTLYGLQWNNHLYEIDPLTAEVSYLGQVGLPTAIHTLDADAAGDLYAPTFNPLEDDDFWQIDPMTLDADNVAPAPSEISAMVFGTNDVLYAIGGSTLTLFEVDLAAGEWSELFTLDTLSDVDGLEFVPEPTSLVLSLTVFAILLRPCSPMRIIVGGP